MKYFTYPTRFCKAFHSARLSFWTLTLQSRCSVLTQFTRHTLHMYIRPWNRWIDRGKCLFACEWCASTHGSVNVANLTQTIGSVCHIQSYFPDIIITYYLFYVYTVCVLGMQIAWNIWPTTFAKIWSIQQGTEYCTGLYTIFWSICAPNLNNLGAQSKI